MVGPVILVGCARRRSVVRDLRSTGMCPGQWSREVDAATGNLHASRMRTSQWSSDRESGGTEIPDRGNNRRLGVSAAVDSDGLAFIKTGHVCGGKNSCSRASSSAHRSGTRGANGCDDGILKIRTRINKDRLASTEAFHAGDLDVRRACGRGSRQSGSGLRQEIAAIAVSIGAVGESSCARIDGNRASVVRYK
jgi:hypothetical protein